MEIIVEATTFKIIHIQWQPLPLGGGREGASHQHRPLHQILQFTDIAREGEALEIDDGIGRGCDKGQMVLLADLTEEVIHEEGDVLGL